MNVPMVFSASSNLKEDEVASSVTRNSRSNFSRRLGVSAVKIILSSLRSPCVLGVSAVKSGASL
jgi:hypothetical protein